MDQNLIDELMKKPKEELVAMIIRLDRKLFELVKDLSETEEHKGIVLDKSLNDFFAATYEEE